METTIKKIGLLVVGILMIVISGCSNLDYDNTTAISPDNVWNDKKMIKAFLNDIQGSLMPGWPVNGNESDEAFNGPGSMGDYLRGVISAETTGRSITYGNIDKINFFLDKVAVVSNGVLTDNEKKELIGQALFWRAWDYWSKVNTFGGVPLILKP